MYGMLLSYGPDLRVLEPAYVAERIRYMAVQTAGNYED